MCSLLYFGGPEAAVALAPVLHEHLIGVSCRVVPGITAARPPRPLRIVGEGAAATAFFSLAQVIPPRHAAALNGRSSNRDIWASSLRNLWSISSNRSLRLNSSVDLLGAPWHSKRRAQRSGWHS